MIYFDFVDELDGSDRFMSDDEFCDYITNTVDPDSGKIVSDMIEDEQWEMLQSTLSDFAIYAKIFRGTNVERVKA